MMNLVSNQRRLFESGQTHSLAFRKEQLLKLKSVLINNEKLLSDAIYSDFNKSLFDTYVTELALVIKEIDIVLKKLKRWAAFERVRTNIPNLPGRSFIVTEPYGTVLIIGAWNYPFLLTLVPIVSAMSAGNTIILKPSELTANTSKAMAELINYNFKPEYLWVQEGGINETTALLEQKFDKIFFTGSTQVGKIIYQAAAKNLTPVTLELGGKSPAFVLPDTNIDVTARRIVWGKFLNAGQTCVAPDYLMVHASIEKQLILKMQQYIIQFFGKDASKCNSYVKIVNFKNFQRLVALIDPKKVVYGGKNYPSELIIEPTVMSNVAFTDAIMQEEIFGPILPIITYTDLDQAMQEVKKLDKPLALYVFTKNQKHMDYLLKNLSFGGGCINDTVMHLSNSHLPFGGVGNSGIGNYHGKHGYDCFSHKKGILKKGFLIEILLKYPPYTDTKLKWIRRIMRIS